MRIPCVLVAILYCAPVASAQTLCGGHDITWVGGAPRAMDRFRRNHESASVPEPEGFNAHDRELWDALLDTDACGRWEYSGTLTRG